MDFSFPAVSSLAIAKAETINTGDSNTRAQRLTIISRDNTATRGVIILHRMVTNRPLGGITQFRDGGSTEDAATLFSYERHVAIVSDVYRGTLLSSSGSPVINIGPLQGISSRETRFAIGNQECLLKAAGKLANPNRLAAGYDHVLLGLLCGDIGDRQQFSGALVSPIWRQ